MGLNEHLFFLPGVDNSVKPGGQQFVQHGLESGPGRIAHGLEVGTGQLGFDFLQVGYIEGNVFFDLIFSGNGHEIEQADAAEFLQEPVKR